MSEAGNQDGKPGASTQVTQDLVEAIRVQAEEHPLIDDKAPETLPEKCLHLMHLKAYDEASRLAAGRDVLDVGCNTGYGTIQLVGAARSVTGVDVSPGAVEAARSRPGGEGVDFRVIDGLGLPFPDASFDLVTSFQVLEHVADPKPYLLEIRRVLRPGGRALFTTPNAAIRLDPGMKPWNRFHPREYRAGQLQSVLDEVFSAVEVRGMFGVPTLYDLEIERVDANRRNVRQRLANEAANAAAAAANAAAAAADAAAKPPAPARPAAPGPSGLRRLRRWFGRTAAGSMVRRTLRGGTAVTAPTPPGSAAPPASPPATQTAAPVTAPQAAPTQVADHEAAGPVVLPDVVDIDAFVVDDLFYSGRDLDKSMDLMAICLVGE